MIILSFFFSFYLSSQQLQPHAVFYLILNMTKGVECHHSPTVGAAQPFVCFCRINTCVCHKATESPFSFFNLAVYHWSILAQWCWCRNFSTWGLLGKINKRTELANRFNPSLLNISVQSVVIKLDVSFYLPQWCKNMTFRYFLIISVSLGWF